MEASIIKRMGLDSMDGGLTDNLFSIHFSLFHSLYVLRQEKGLSGFYCHLDPMRIRIIPMPSDGSCSHYFPEKGTFCSLKAKYSSYCDIHERQYAGIEMKLQWDPLLEFYINPENIKFGNSKILEKLMNGIAIYAFRRGEVEKALEFFEIEYPRKAIINKRYRELALVYHPDKNGGDDSQMKDLNRFYSVLREVYPA